MQIELLMTGAVQGPALASASRAIQRRGAVAPYLPQSHDHTNVKDGLSWESTIGQGFVIKPQCCGFPPPRLLKLVCDHVPSVVVLSFKQKGRRASGAGAGERPDDISSPMTVVLFYGPSSSPLRSPLSELAPERSNHSPFSFSPPTKYFWQ